MIARDPEVTSKEQLRDNTYKHQQDVRNLLLEVQRLLMLRGDNHDWSKLRTLDMFYAAYENKFAGSTWFKGHAAAERHHFTSASSKVTAADITLIDVIERMCDCIASGTARCGKVTPDTDLPMAMLEQAYKNTWDMLCQKAVGPTTK